MNSEKHDIIKTEFDPYILNGVDLRIFLVSHLYSFLACCCWLLARDRPGLPF